MTAARYDMSASRCDRLPLKRYGHSIDAPVTPSIVFAIAMLVAQPIEAQSEKSWADELCPSNGIREHRNDDWTRVDCLTPEFAIEYDFADKWYSCFGQALHYGFKTNRRPKCVLITTPDTAHKVHRYKQRIEALANHHDIDITVEIIRHD